MYLWDPQALGHHLRWGKQVPGKEVSLTRAVSSHASLVASHICSHLDSTNSLLPDPSDLAFPFLPSRRQLSEPSC